MYKNSTQIKDELKNLNFVSQMLCEDYAEIVDEEDADYSSPTRDFELDRSRVDLVEIIGEGQFGDVYRGIYSPSSTGLEPVPVAVKTCKIDQDGSMADKFLEEACKSIGIRNF